MNYTDEITAQLPVSEIAQQLGVDQATVESAVQDIIPALLGGMEANARDSGGAASLLKALSQHVDDPAPSHLSDIDTAEGQRIVRHIFGANDTQVSGLLDNRSGGSGIVQRLMPILAPLVLAWLAKSTLGGQGSSRGRPSAAGGGGGGLGGLLEGLSGEAGSGSGGGGGGIGNLLESLTGGGQSGGGPSSGGLGDLLGNVLGGGGQANAGDGGTPGDLRDLLGGLLGGGTREQ